MDICCQERSLLLYIFHVIMECDFGVHVRGCIHLQILNHSKHVTECHQTRLPLHTPHLLGHLCEKLKGGYASTLAACGIQGLACFDGRETPNLKTNQNLTTSLTGSKDKDRV